MAYYRNNVTDKSWQLLMRLKKEYQFVLIGGWAVWLYTEQLKSKDIDIVVEHSDLEKLKYEYDIEKNERLGKYQFRQGEVEVDVYVPYYSDLGLPAEIVMANKQLVDGFWVPRVELLLALKVVSFVARIGSAKGRKDWLDIISLLNQIENFEAKKITEWSKHDLVNSGLKLILDELRLATEVKELGINQHQMAKIKRGWLNKLQAG